MNEVQPNISPIQSQQMIDEEPCQNLDRSYSQNSLDSSGRTSTPGKLADEWIEDESSFSHQSEDDRKQSEANFREIDSYLNEIYTTEDESYETAAEESHNGSKLQNEQNDNEGFVPQHNLRNRNELKKPNRLIEETEESTLTSKAPNKRRVEQLRMAKLTKERDAVTKTTGATKNCKVAEKPSSEQDTGTEEKNDTLTATPEHTANRLVR